MASTISDLKFQVNNKINPKINIQRFHPDDVFEVRDLIHNCLDRYVARVFEDTKVIDGLKSLYSYDRILQKYKDSDTEVWVARNRSDKIRWAMALKEYHVDPNAKIVENGLEISMFYGLCPLSANDMITLAQHRVMEKGLTYLSGTIIPSGWHAFERRGNEDGVLYTSKPYEKTETNADNWEPFSLWIRYFKFLHRDLVDCIEANNEHSCLA